MAHLSKLSDAAGTWITESFTSDKADELPDGKIMLGGPWPSPKPDLTVHSCYLCKQPTATNNSDAHIFLENPGMIVVCVECFRALQDE